MKKDFLKLVIRFSLFILPLLLVEFSIEYKLSLLPTSYALKKQHLEQYAPDIEILTLGSSHGLYDINPDLFSKLGFNFANSGQSLILDSKLSLEWLDKLPKLKLIVLPISYFSLKYSLIRGDEFWRDTFYFKTYGVSEDPEPSFLLKLDPRYQLRLWMFGPQHLFELLSDNPFRSALLGQNISKKGWLSADVPSAEQKANFNDADGRRQVKRHENLMHEDLLDSNLVALDSLIRGAQKRNINIVFITTPVSQAYWKVIDFKKLSNMQNSIQHLCEKYSVNYYNYLQDNRFNIDDFYDYDHLNKNGAQKFSHFLDEEVIKKEFKIQ